MCQQGKKIKRKRKFHPGLEKQLLWAIFVGA